MLLSNDWESPSGRPVRFHIPTTFQIAGRSLGCRSVGHLDIDFGPKLIYVSRFAGKLKQLIPTRANIQKVEQVKTKVPASVRIYPDFPFTTNLIKAKLISVEESKCSSLSLVHADCCLFASTLLIELLFLCSD